MPKNYLNHIKKLSKEVGELLKFKDLLINALNSSSEGIALLDSNGKYIWLNKAHSKMFGYCHTELIGKSWETLYRKKDLDFFHNTVFPKLHKEGKWRGKTKGIKKDGKTLVKQRVYLTALDNGSLVCTCIGLEENE